MKQQVYEDALKRIVELSRKSARSSPHVLLADIEREALQALGKWETGS